MADLILAGGDVITFDPQRPAASAVAITGGRITAVGDRHDVRHWRGARTEVIDLGASRCWPARAAVTCSACGGPVPTWTTGC